MKGLYIVTPDWDDTAKMVEVTEKALTGGAQIVQYRHKTAGPELLLEQARALRDLCRRYEKPFIINDYVDLCLELDTDGIHVGGMDVPVKKVRAAVGPDKIVGASCYGDLELARKATRDGASYVAFGGFYPSRVKKYPVTTPQNIVSDWKKETPSMPVCVIGGMSVENAIPLVELGADMVAVVSGVYFQDDPEAAARGFAQLFK
ncbi:thiamine phosphate synthase [Oxalobacter paraformigenes]|uniref:Thiamine-phosphate synthase n=1 Tax=Oxalobacter paraformigenes TaxID=556268 RepID=C3X5F5_9BURK|nr:thiamine phosphate synthase [Oxalobacter paraformigenes]EEO28441.1 thiamine-phosphate pyrophosphorylase [Oxalobacter paraformigenes]